MLDEPVDTICGYVKGKNASGGDTEEMPFLYIIRDDRDGEAYFSRWKELRGADRARRSLQIAAGRSQADAYFDVIFASSTRRPAARS
jgi:hypothetical protein